MLLRMIHLKITHTQLNIGTGLLLDSDLNAVIKNENNILDLWSFTEKAMQIQQINKLS